MSVKISQKTKQSGSAHIERKIAVFIDINIEVTADLIAVFLQHIQHVFQRGVDLRVFGAAGFIYVLYGDRIGKLVVSEKLSVAVVNISAGAGDGAFLFNL